MVARPLPAATMLRARARRSWNQWLMSREAGIIPAQLYTRPTMAEARQYRGNWRAAPNRKLEAASSSRETVQARRRPRRSTRALAVAMPTRMKKLRTVTIQAPWVLLRPAYSSR